jgi:hypothetical protein
MHLKEEEEKIKKMGTQQWPRLKNPIYTFNVHCFLKSTNKTNYP